MIQEKNIHHPPFSCIEKSYVINGVTFEILSPPDDFKARKTWEKWRDSNNNSLVLRVSFGSTSFFFPGDIMADAEEALVRAPSADLKSTVLLAPHHGSRTSSTVSFLTRVDPEVVVISSGNGFGMPHKRVLERYKSFNCLIYRTDLHGALEMTSDGMHLEIKPTVTGEGTPAAPG